MFSYKAFLTFFAHFIYTQKGILLILDLIQNRSESIIDRYCQGPIVRRCQVSTAVNCSRFQIDIQAENEIQSRRIRMPIFSIDFMRICFKKFSSGDSLDIFEFHIGMEYPHG